MFWGGFVLLFSARRLCCAAEEVKLNVGFAHAWNSDLCVTSVSCFHRNCSEHRWLGGMEESSGEYCDAVAQAVNLFLLPWISTAVNLVILSLTSLI